MSFFKCLSRSSLKGMVRDDDDENGSGNTTPNDTAHGGSKFGSYSWKRLSAKSRSSLNSPKKPPTPPLSATSADGTGPPRASLEPVMERTRSTLTDMEAVKFLVEDWSHKQWRPATPQDQERFDRLEQSDIKPLVALGEGAYGSVNLCRIAANAPGHSKSSAHLGRHSAQPATSPFSGSTPQPPKMRASSTSTAGGTAAANESGDHHVAPQAAGRGMHRRTASAPGRHGLLGGAADDLAEVGTAEATSDGDGEDVAADAAASGSGAVTDGGGSAAASPSGSDAAVEASAAATALSLRSSAGTAVSADSEGGPLADVDVSADMGAAASTGDGATGDDGAAPVRMSETMQPASSVNDQQLIVAVKRVPLGWNQERELMQLHRCQQCPFIVRLFGFVEDGSEHCSYVMEWAEGGDLGVMLSSLKSRRGANKQRLLMSETSARYYLGCLMLALEFLHAHGLLHRDIKPSNLLLTSDGTAKLADLGFTVAMDANGHTVGCCGTTGYIAPEVFSYGSSKSRMAYGVPADIWSAGATLYQILTGQVVTDHPEEVLRKGWRPPTHPRFSPQLQDMLNRMLAVKPTARPQSAASVMRHAWFTGFDWKALREGRMKAPYVPSERRRARLHAPGGAAGSAGGAAMPASGAAAGGAGGGPPTACPGGQRLPPVMEGASTPQADSGQQLVVQRSALSGQGEGSVKHGRAGLVRDGASFETTLGTVTTAEVKTARDSACAVTAATAAAAAAVVAADAAELVVATPLQPGCPSGGTTAVHGHGHGLTVRFAVGVAECA